MNSVSEQLNRKKLLLMCVVAGGAISGPLYAEWPHNQPEKFNAPKIGDFPPENIDELLQQGNPDLTGRADTAPEEVQPLPRYVPQPGTANQTTQHFNQPANPQAPQYAGQQQVYGAYPQGGQGWNRGYGPDRKGSNKSWGNGPMSNGPWNNRGSGFNMPWGNNRSGFSGPWNGNWGGNSWDNRRNSGAPWSNNRGSFSAPWDSNNGSGFNMPWGNNRGNNNSGFRPW